MFKITSSLLTILSLLDAYHKTAFTNGVLLKPTSTLMLQLGQYFNEQNTWKMRALKAIQFLQSFKAKSKNLFRL